MAIKSAFCLATDTIKVLSSSSGGTSARSHSTPPADVALEMDGRVCVGECGRGWRELRDGGSRTVSPKGGRAGSRGPQTTTAAPILTAPNTKRAPSVPPASGPPSLPACQWGRVLQSPPSALLNPLPLPAGCCLFSQAE